MFSRSELTSWALAGTVALGAMSTSVEAAAFREAGHRAIEAAAYRRLLATEGGRRELVALIEHGILSPPARPIGDPAELLDPDYGTYTVESLLVESHLPDHLFDRQLQADRQCFHFNARGGHYKLTDRTYGSSSIPRGLVEDAYLECVGVADALLRGVLFDPRGSQKQANGVYTLMHMIEDSFADSHVARVAPAVSQENAWKIVYVKPWNLRTWPRYFLLNKHEAPIRSHFSAEHHMGSDTRDLGYLIGPTDEDYPELASDPHYQQRLKTCVDDGARLIRRHLIADHEDKPISILDMQGELVVPESCLSARALRATDAIVDLLLLLAEHAPKVAMVPHAGGGLDSAQSGVKRVESLDAGWRAYRRKHLAHYDGYLTEHMAPRGPGRAAPIASREDLVYSSSELAPRHFHESGIGLTTELRSGTPLWLGLDEFLSRKTSSHNRPVLLLDTLGWGVQVRLPIENELGERPVGVAVDIGAGLPLPVSELFGLQELQLFFGFRGRASYAAQSVFEAETRHTVELGFGGISLDAVVGNTAWFGFDAPRAMYQYDLWTNESDWQNPYWSFSGGVAVDAF